MEADRSFSAAQARALTKNSKCTINRLYRIIEDAAKRNASKAYSFDLADMTSEKIDEIIDTLRADGYTVTKEVQSDMDGDIASIILDIEW